jgi:hypothetical protein
MLCTNWLHLCFIYLAILTTAFSSGTNENWAIMVINNNNCLLYVRVTHLYQSGGLIKILVQL